MAEFKDMLEDMESNPEFYNQFLDEKGALLDNTDYHSETSVNDDDDDELITLDDAQQVSIKENASLGAINNDSDDELLNTDFIYINTNIHDNNISMCIDTTCPTSLISRKDARNLNIFSLLQPYHKKIRKNNLSFSQDGIGFLENIPVLINNEIFHFDFNVYESSNIQATIGLDNLRKYKAIINLESDYLKLGTMITKFTLLGEKPKNYSQSNYKKLCELGFNTDLIIQTLIDNNDNLELSISKLLNA